ncbi:competence protein CoiA [Neobacillus sp. SM06]|uniref:competence protein CoiA n=1 Tax=Neobacillus sp. SM06 TaxID=3422492 RepID=UPI003D290D1F
MLSALTKAGKRISLGYPYKKETLLYFRSKEEFFCPICGEKVYLKLGEQKIFHFAHRSGGACREFYENETEYHMDGKLQLYRWLKKQKIDAVLEYYDKDIKQRPDIAFQVNGQKFALEYQCSSLPEKNFTKRTNLYLQKGYMPLWIVGGNHLKESQPGAVSLNSFHYLFLRENADRHMFLPFFSPEHSRFIVLSSIFPYTTKYALVKKAEFPLKQSSVQSIINPVILPVVNSSLWKTRADLHQSNWCMHPGKEQKNFFEELYINRLNPFLLPVEIGLPIPHGQLIQTLPFVWQTYFYLDVLFHKNPGEWISPDEIKSSFLKRVASGQIMVRITPQVTSDYALEAVKEYLHMLEKLGRITPLQNGYFRVETPLVIPKTNSEKEAISKNFAMLK